MIVRVLFWISAVFLMGCLAMDILSTGGDAPAGTERPAEGEHGGGERTFTPRPHIRDRRHLLAADPPGPWPPWPLGTPCGVYPQAGLFRRNTTNLSPAETGTGAAT